ncbi:10649_t:CDS:1 [Acaulospora morrowiae]|uniref:10649_t:CDS:1 n=1 Tax=Acaulospora morrowiae TaxID=94023 RepID=A0A9N9DFN5_9GLOM|nr:10649_t:CDS:1 [Acaulospora morrowiae]
MLAIAHFCYDWIQSVPVLYSPQQIGPLYFKSMHLVSIFEINDTGNQPQSHQINYLIDEGKFPIEVAKGANTTLSLVYDTLIEYNRNEKNIKITCDNCGG